VLKFLFYICLFVTLLMPQTALAENFGKPIEAYAIRPGLILTITRYPDGKPKTMIIESALAAHDMEKLDFPGMLSQKMIDELIEQLIPIESRGAKIETSKVGICADYCSFAIAYYENVRIDLLSGMVWQKLDKPFDQTYKDRMERLIITWPDKNQIKP
jgi:hypothetical protein